MDIPDLKITRYLGKIEGKNSYDTVGYLDVGEDGRPKLKLNVEAVERAIKSRREYEREHGKEASKQIYLDVYPQDRSRDREPKQEEEPARGGHAEKETKRRRSRKQETEEGYSR
jgi:hypothetical protein